MGQDAMVVSNKDGNEQERDKRWVKEQMDTDREKHWTEGKEKLAPVRKWTGEGELKQERHNQTRK